MEETSVNDDVVNFLNKTGVECAMCGDDVLYTDEVFMITVVHTTITPIGMTYEPVRADDEDYLYSPRVMSLECWEEVLEELREMRSDTPPLTDDRAVLECSVCESGIRIEESLAVVEFGEIHCSIRCPDSKSTSIFEPYDPNPTTLCISCLLFLSDNVCSLWDGDVQESDECKEGTHGRCWRLGCEGKTACINQLNNSWR